MGGGRLMGGLGYTWQCLALKWLKRRKGNDFTFGSICFVVGRVAALAPHDLLRFLRGSARQTPLSTCNPITSPRGLQPLNVLCHVLKITNLDKLNKPDMCQFQSALKTLSFEEHICK